MIESFRHRGLRRLYERGDRSGIGPSMVVRIVNILSVLETAESIEQIDIPGYRLHPLTGNLRGYWSIRVTGNWRILFRIEENRVLDIDLVDYH
ncbi:MAG TPA: type II toxin-antitoxin system mRNA interferase toxin, RelE/StbE family [Thermomicrobiales bacterium]|nr:type II toxin-antitoxin system mRNA interferase toxin, RelE/StbE family [Thermomicrobiales bacterium]